jgi:iron(III)-enterobactin esterase
MTSPVRFLSAAVIVCLIASVSLGFAQSVTPAQTPASHTERPTSPTRDPHTPGYVTAKELPDGSIPPSDFDGNFIIGPTHNPATELSTHRDLAN